MTHKELEIKLAKGREKAKKKSLEIKRLRAKVRDLSKSRDLWKQKYKDQKGLVNADNELFRVPPFSNVSLRPPRHHYSLWLIHFCICLRVTCGCSYRRIPLILSLLNEKMGISLPIPSRSSVQNWVEKVGLSLLENPSLPFSEMVLIVDESIGMGPHKLLGVLVADAQHWTQGALHYGAVQVAHLSIRTQSKAQEVGQILDDLVQRWKNRIVGIVSDGCSKLKKAIRLVDLPHILDISHLLATCLKKAYAKEPTYEAFRRQLGAWRAEGACQKMSYLIPPKQRKKARFMNQKPLIEWALRMKRDWHSLPQEAQLFFKDLPKYYPLIDSLSQALCIAQKVSQKLKQEGLSSQNLALSQEIIQQYRATKGSLLNNFQKYLRQYLAHYQELADKQCRPIPCCSDVLESMFGKTKSWASDNPLGIISSACLQLPLHTLQREDLGQVIYQGLEDFLHNDLKAWKAKNIPESQTVKRNQFFKKEVKKKAVSV